MSELNINRVVVKALSENREVEFKCGGAEWKLLVATQQPLSIIIDPSVEFRLKPQTVVIEVPKPFEPKAGDMVWCLNEFSENGYEARTAYESDDFVANLAYWRTEDEIKIVVEQIKKLRGE